MSNNSVTLCLSDLFALVIRQPSNNPNVSTMIRFFLPLIFFLAVEAARSLSPPFSQTGYLQFQRSDLRLCLPIISQLSANDDSSFQTYHFLRDSSHN